MRAVLLLAAVGCFAAFPLSAIAQTPVIGDAPVAPVASDSPVADAPPAERSARGTFTVDAEWVLWFLREGRVPPLLTTSSPAFAGRIGIGDTSVLYGDSRVKTRHDDAFNGVRIDLGWMSADCDFGVEARAFFLERDSTFFKATSDGSQLLALAYTNPTNDQPSSRIIAGPTQQRGTLSGGFVGYSRIEWFGEEANAVVPLLSPGGPWRLDLLAGLRFLQMRDRFEQTATSRSLPDGATLYGIMDNFRTWSTYYGGQVGLSGERCFGRFFVQMRGTIGIGGDAEQVRTFGQSIVQTPQSKTVTQSGLYVQPSNSGSVSRGNFDGVGEVAINVGYQVTTWARVFAGYTFLYWADPLRAGDQVDTVVNVQQATTPSPARPGVPLKGDALWAQGVNVGVELRW
jgi:hypothetical protein